MPMRMLCLRNALRRGLLSLAVLSVVSGLAHGQSAGALGSVKARTLPPGVVDEGAVPHAMPMRATIYLQPDAGRIAALQQFLVDVQTPGSGSYRQWLTPAQFASRFGASSGQIADAESVVVAAGLKVESVSGLRMVVSGSAEELEATFSPGSARGSGWAGYVCGRNGGCEHA